MQVLTTARAPSDRWERPCMHVLTTAPTLFPTGTLRRGDRWERVPRQVHDGRRATA